MNTGMKRGRQAPIRGTEKVTISLSPAALEVMQRLAKRDHGGNLSGAFSELVEHATRLEAMDRVIEELPRPSKRGLARLEAELAAPLAAPRAAV